MKYISMFIAAIALMALGTSCVTQEGDAAPVQGDSTAVVEEKAAAALDTPVKAAKSQAINELSYDADAKKLTVVFDRGTYVYADVPVEVYEGLKNSESQGTFYRNEVRGKYKGTRVKK